ncbi:MAG TPA: CPBP family intramembrane glutamic endopeptidase [Acidimicrobiia bacterium]|jgi:membrane protease YdiL (CAAX protease family)
MLPRVLHLPELEAQPGPDADREATIVLVAATVLLLVFDYWGRPGFYERSGLIDWVAVNVGGPLGEHPGAASYLWWGLSSLGLRLLAPLAVIVWLVRRSPGDYGFRIRGISRHLPMYGVMYLVMLPLLVWVSSFESFRTFYPFYDRAAEGGAGYWLYSVGYGLQFVGVEAFFRGFLTFGLLRKMGAVAIPVMTVPYVMIHFSKPMPEATAAIFAGLLLGYMAVKSKSFVPGIMLHVAVALTMDLLVLGREGALGNLF